MCVREAVVAVYARVGKVGAEGARKPGMDAMGVGRIACVRERGCHNN